MIFPFITSRNNVIITYHSLIKYNKCSFLPISHVLSINKSLKPDQFCPDQQSFIKDYLR